MSPDIAMIKNETRYGELHINCIIMLQQKISTKYMHRVPTDVGQQNSRTFLGPFANFQGHFL